ncbi:unnamed protein product [Discosporangium mesarthrocarpum]
MQECQYKEGKYRHYFEVQSPMGSMRLRAEDAESKEAWVKRLKKEVQAPPSVAHFCGHGDAASTVSTNSPRPPFKNQASQLGSGLGRGVAAGGRGGEGDEGPHGLADGEQGGALEDKESGGNGRPEKGEGHLVLMKEKLEEEKRLKRFQFFQDQRQFIRELTNICEELRYQEDRSLRGALLEELLQQTSIPACSYLPLCKSTDPFRKVIRPTPNEAKAFSTKERCPALVTFETCEQRQAEPGEDTEPLDVASFLHYVYGSYSPQQQAQPDTRSSVSYSTGALFLGGVDDISPAALEVTFGLGLELRTCRGRRGGHGHRNSRSGSFLFRGGLQLPNMHVHLPGKLPTVWRDRERESGPGKTPKSKSPFPNLSRQALMRPRSVRLPGVKNKKSQHPSPAGPGGRSHFPIGIGGEGRASGDVGGGARGAGGGGGGREGEDVEMVGVALAEAKKSRVVLWSVELIPALTLTQQDASPEAGEVHSTPRNTSMQTTPSGQWLGPPVSTPCPCSYP